MVIFVTGLIYSPVGCPECAHKCNYDFKNKLSILFPTMPSKKIDDVLATENGKCTGTVYTANEVVVRKSHVSLYRRKIVLCYRMTTCRFHVMLMMHTHTSLYTAFPITMLQRPKAL